MTEVIVFSVLYQLQLFHLFYIRQLLIIVLGLWNVQLQTVCFSRTDNLCPWGHVNKLSPTASLYFPSYVPSMWTCCCYIFFDTLGLPAICLSNSVRIQWVNEFPILPPVQFMIPQEMNDWGGEVMGIGVTLVLYSAHFCPSHIECSGVLS